MAAGGLDRRGERASRRIETAGLAGALVESAAPVEQEADYREFVAVTGFDYSRDLNRLWLAILPAASGVERVGIARGRFEQAKVLGYARAQGAREVSLGGLTAYAVDRPESERRFAFVFLDHEHIGFAETLAGIERILACVRKAAPAVTTDGARRTRLEQFSAGMQLWVTDEEMSRWALPPLDREPELAAQFRRLALAARANGEGIELIVDGETREPGQAQRLREGLEAYGLVGHVLLARRTDPTSLALREALRQASLEQQGKSLSLRLRLSREALVALLVTPPASPQAQAGPTPRPAEKSNRVKAPRSR